MEPYRHLTPANPKSEGAGPCTPHVQQIPIKNSGTRHTLFTEQGRRLLYPRRFRTEAMPRQRMRSLLGTPVGTFSTSALT